MYPLLAAGASAVANNFLGSLSGMMSTRRSANAGTPDFSAMMQQNAAATRKPPTIQEQIASLKAQLLGTPELQTALNTADPTHGASISISEGGAVTYTAQDGRQTPLHLSPATANLARQLGGMMSQNGQQGGAMPLTGANSVRTLNVFA